MQQIPTSLWTLLIGVVVTLISFWVGQNHHLLPEQASEQAPLVDDLFNVMVTIGTALFLVVQGAIVIAMVKFRRRPGDETDGSPMEGSIPLEILWTAIPSVIVIGLGLYSVQVFQGIGGFGSEAGMMGHGMMGHVHAAAPQSPDRSVPPGSAIAAPLLADAQPLSPEAMAAQAALDAPEALVSTVYGIGAPASAAQANSDLVVNVTGMQFAWIFEYPNQGITSGELHIPLGQRVRLQMKAVDVIHSFWVPQFRLKQDVMPGLDSELEFVATKTGTFPVVCAELCGSYHGAMRTTTVVHPPEEFDTWVQSNQVAQHESHQTIAMNPGEMSDTEFLAPYAQEIGLGPEAITHLQQMDSQHTRHQS